MFGSDQRWSKVIRKHNSGNMCDVCSRRCLTHFVFVPYNSNHIPNMFCHVLPRHALNVNDSEGSQEHRKTGKKLFRHMNHELSILLSVENVYHADGKKRRLEVLSTLQHLVFPPAPPAYSLHYSCYNILQLQISSCLVSGSVPKIASSNPLI